MANQADFNVRTMCRVLKVSASGYYAWRDRAPSLRRIANAVLMERIREIHRESGESYGMPGSGQSCSSKAIVPAASEWRG